MKTKELEPTRETVSKRASGMPPKLYDLVLQACNILRKRAGLKPVSVLCKANNPRIGVNPECGCVIAQTVNTNRAGTAFAYGWSKAPGEKIQFLNYFGDFSPVDTFQRDLIDGKYPKMLTEYGKAQQ